MDKKENTKSNISQNTFFYDAQKKNTGLHISAIPLIFYQTFLSDCILPLMPLVIFERPWNNANNSQLVCLCSSVAY